MKRSEYWLEAFEDIGEGKEASLQEKRPAFSGHLWNNPFSKRVLGSSGNQ
ncbi:hypothetical protein LAV79_26750 [Peribacillus butanolivorans]